MVLFLTGTPGPGAHYHVDNVDLSSWQVEMFVKSLYQNVILFWNLEIFILICWEWMVWITGTTEGCEDLEASISTRVLDVLSWGDSNHPLSWGHHHCQHQHLVPLYQGFEFRSMESNDDDLGNGLLSKSKILLSGWTTTHHLQKMSKQSVIQKPKGNIMDIDLIGNSFCKLVADVWCRFCSSGTRTRAECQHGEWVWLGWANPIFCGLIDVVCALIKVHCSQTWFTCSLNDLNYYAFDLILNVHLYTKFWTLALAL